MRTPQKNEISPADRFFPQLILAAQGLCLPGRFAAQKTKSEPGVVPLARSRLPGLREWARPLLVPSRLQDLYEPPHFMQLFR